MIFTISGDEVIGTPSPGYERMMKEMLERWHIVDGGGREVSVEGSPKEWFDALPSTYSSSYLRAEISE